MYPLQVFKPPGNGCAPDYQYSPPVVNSLILFPIKVTREKFNCAFGNSVNLLKYINHFNTDLKWTLLISQLNQKAIASEK